MPAYAPDLLNDAHLFITGGGTGLGRAMAEYTANLGAKVTVCGRRPDPLAETQQAIEDAGGQAAGVQCNVRDADSVEAAIAEAEDKLGPVTHLLNNAAANFLAKTETLSPNAFDAIVKTNLYGSFYATTACGRRWIERGTPGVVLSIATTYVFTGSAFVVPSAVSKAGIVAMTQSLAVEWGAHGIRLNAIAPGPFPTKGAWDRLVPDGNIEQQMKRRVPLGRFGEPHELAGLAAFLLSDLSAYMSGEVVTIDGAEWIASGGQFNDLAKLPRKQVDAMFDAMRR